MPKKTATLTIDGETFELAYDFNMIADAEEIAGCNLLDALEHLSAINARQLRGLLYAAVISKPRLTLLEAGALLRVDNISPITSALAEAYNLTLPDAPESALADQQDPPAGNVLFVAPNPTES